MLIVFLIAIVNLQIKMNELRDTIESQRQQIVILEDDIAEYQILLDEEKTDDYYDLKSDILESVKSEFDKVFD